MAFTHIPEFTERACTKCIYYYEEWDGEFGNLYCGSYCEKKGQEHFSNLKSFPFRNLKECFIIDFWHTKFPTLLDGEINSRRENLSKFFYRKSDPCGTLSPLYERAWKRALEKFNLKEDGEQ